MVYIVVSWYGLAAQLCRRYGGIGGLFSTIQIGAMAGTASKISKFAMVMALGAIGLKTDFKKLAKSGFTPMLHGFIISALVVVVSFIVQMFLGQM